ncbi:MAG: endonuclease V [archaeon]
MLDIRKLRQEQVELARKVLTTDSFEGIETIGGCDQAFFGKKIVSAVVVLDRKNLKVIETAYAVQEEKIPYIPEYLVYREGPAITEAYNKLKTKPDLLVVDGNGILHPRRIGMASHLGLLLDTATIGVAKKLLTGHTTGDKIVVDKEIRAMLLKTKEHAKPIYVSPGHRISLETSVKIIRECLIGHKLPEPLHIAHKISNKIKKSKIKG